MNARIAVAAVAALSAFGCRAHGQTTPKSQLGSVGQTIARTRIEVVYRRPVAHGRALFGALVPWGRIWTPGADSATRISVSAPVSINGGQLAAGTYSIWAIPDSLSWTIVFSKVAAAFHLSYPNGQDALRVRATPAQADAVETLSFEFPLVDADSAILRLHWGTTIVPLSIHAGPR